MITSVALCMRYYITINILWQVFFKNSKNMRLFIFCINFFDKVNNPMRINPP